MYINRKNEITLFDFLFESGSSAQLSFDFSVDKEDSFAVSNFNLSNLFFELDPSYSIIFNQLRVKAELDCDVDNRLSLPYLCFTCQDILNSSKTIQGLNHYRSKDSILGTDTKIESTLIDYIFSNFLRSYVSPYHQLMRTIFVDLLFSKDNHFSFFNKLKKDNEKVKTIFHVVSSLIEFINFFCDDTDASFFYSLNECEVKEKINSKIIDRLSDSNKNIGNISEQDKIIIENIVYKFACFIQDFLLKSIEYTKQYYVDAYCFDNSFFNDNDSQNVLFGLNLNFNNILEADFNIFNKFECNNYDIFYNILNNNINISIKDNKTGKVFDFNPEINAFISERSLSSNTQLLFLSHSSFNKYFLDYKCKLINSLTTNNLDLITF